LIFVPLKTQRMRFTRFVPAWLPLLPLLAALPSPKGPVFSSQTTSPSSTIFPLVTETAYAAWNLSAAGIPREAFEEALSGYNCLIQRKQVKKSDVLTIIDYGRPSTEKRLFVIDMQEGNILFNTLVAHGRNSGTVFATDFSNEAESKKSSLGFFIASDTYLGANGYSLRLEGCEQGINDHARERAIVMHGAEYVNENFIRSHGYLGRSYGCPAIPVECHEKVIDRIKNGSCVFLYHPGSRYRNQSKILNL
jgi:hypothetical protein